MADSKPFEVNLYDGAVHLRRQSNHVYRVRVEGGKSLYVPNATSIIGMKDKSRALIPWALRTAAKAFDQSVPTGARITMNPAQKQKIMEALVNAPDVVRDRAGDVGREVHEWIETYLLCQKAGDDLPTIPQGLEITRPLQQFVQWVERNNVRCIGVERPIFSRAHWYTGTADLVLQVGNEIGVYDAKTGKSIYPEVMIQTAAYQAALDEEHPGRPVQHRGVLFFERDDDGNLIGDMEVVRLPDTFERDFETFLALKTVYRFDKDGIKDLRSARYS